MLMSGWDCSTKGWRIQTSRSHLVNSFPPGTEREASQSGHRPAAPPLPILPQEARSVGRRSGQSWNNQFNYPVDTETVEAPSLPRHTLADPVVVNCHGHSERSRRPAARQLHLSGDKLVIVLETDFSLPSVGPSILPTRRRTVERGSLPLG